tara:strand:+ start:22 stop:237 length:216 start_codon:yes stop_codon:yes gene_type:complete
MNEDDITQILHHNYWPAVDIDEELFRAKLYKKYVRGKYKGWKQVKSRTFQTPLEAWDYLKETLTDTLKFVL